VLFAHDTEMNLVAVVALVNTLYGSPRDVDALATTDDLDAWLHEHSYSYAPAATPALLAEIQAMREPFRELFTATRDGAVETVNAWLTEADALPQLVRHDHLDWHIHAERPGSSLPVQLQVETAMALIDVIRSDEMQRFSTCQDENCEGVVLDLSRNRSRRYCSTACSNRAAVAAYRARQA
jgi:predicted RNA-binding Zn ribbon-like protein